VLSGAGPSVLVLAHDGAERTGLAKRAPAGWRALSLPVAPGGAHLVGADR
jgi:hypothetical protein